MYYWVEKHGHICAVESLESLSGRARDVLQDVSLDDVTLERMGSSEAALGARGWARPGTWLALATLLEFEDEVVASRALPAVAKLHGRLVAKGTAHLELLVENIMRTSWMAGAVLQSDPQSLSPLSFLGAPSPCQGCFWATRRSRSVGCPGHKNTQGTATTTHPALLCGLVAPPESEDS